MGLLRILAAASLCAAALTGCGGDADNATPSTAQDHPEWSAAVSRCSQGLVDAADSAPPLSYQQMLGSRGFHAERRIVCEQLTQCQWEETGNPAVEFTVKSQNAFEDCYGLVFSQFE